MEGGGRFAHDNDSFRLTLQKQRKRQLLGIAVALAGWRDLKADTSTGRQMRT